MKIARIYIQISLIWFICSLQSFVISGSFTSLVCIESCGDEEIFIDQDSVMTDQLPQEVLQILNTKLPGWKWGDVSQYVKRFFDPHNKSEYPRFITGDFDGDDRKDYALKVTMNWREGKTDVVVAFLDRDSTYAYYVLRVSRSISDVYVVLDKKGNRLYNYATSKYFTMANDGVGVYYFEKAGGTFIFKDGEFRGIATSD